MNNAVPVSSLVGKRKRKKDPNPNPLFSKWLAEWRDEAKEKGWKSEYIYSKALKSLQKYPLPFSTGKECKILQHFGDKICKMLDDRLAKHKQEQENSASSVNSDPDFPSSSAWTGNSRIPAPVHEINNYPRIPAPVHEISDSSDDDGVKSVGYSKSKPYTTLGSKENSTNSIRMNSVPQIPCQNTAATESDDGNDDVTFIGESSPVNLHSYEDFNDELPELPQLPNLEERERTKLTSESSFQTLKNGVTDTVIAVQRKHNDVTDSVYTVKRKQTVNTHLNIDTCDDLDELPMLPRLPELNGRKERLTKVSENSCQLLSEGVTGAVEVTSVARVVAHSVSDSDNDEAQPPAPPRRGRGGGRGGERGGGRQPKEYVPAYRSGPYAILLTLYRHAQDPNFRGFMTKAELCRAAQPLADKSFTVADPGSRYTAWSSVSILIKKGFLTKESSPAKYRLTDEGYELADRLEQVERRQGEGQGERLGVEGDRSHAPDCNPHLTHDSSDKPYTQEQLPIKNPQKNRTQQTHHHHSYPSSARSSSDSTRYMSPEREANLSLPGTKIMHDKRPDNTDCLVIDDDGNDVDNRNNDDVLDNDRCDIVENDDFDDNNVEDFPRLSPCDGVGNDHFENDNNVDDLPCLSLPSLAQRLKPTLSSSSTSSSHRAAGSRTLHYWYVADGERLVVRKDQAAVLLDDEGGVRFLVKVNYQHLLQSGLHYKLDMTRPLGNEDVFVYLADGDCEEEAQTPSHVSSASSAAATTANSVSQPSTSDSRSSTTNIATTSINTKARPVHAMSDSDSGNDTTSSKSTTTSSSRHISHAPTDNFTGLLSRQPSKTAASKVSHNLKAAEKTNAALKGKVNAVSAESVRCLTSKPPVSSNSQACEDCTVGGDMEDFVLLPGTFDVVLCVDNREFYGSQSSSKSLLPDLVKNGVTCDLRLLNVGDLLWVAREKMTAGHTLGMLGNERPSQRELVLNYVVERKRTDDLVSSIISGRLKEQKFRLKHCGLQEKIILIESYGSLQHFSISEDRIKQAIANTEIIDGFTVKQTKDGKETAAYLTLMTRYLHSYFQNKTLRSCSRDRVKQLGVQCDVADSEQLLMPFNHFNQLSLKNKPLTVLELFAKQLIQLWGMSAEKAKAIITTYPTPTSLLEAYAACSTDKERDSLLANLKYGKNLRNLGIALSRQVAQLYTATVLT